MTCSAARNRPIEAHRDLHGFSLVEILLALAISLLLVAGSVTLLAKARNLQRAADTHARMQETARHALSVIEADLRMAGYWGPAHRPERMTTNPALAFPDRCGGISWVTSIAQAVDGTNNRYLGVSNCAASAGGAVAGADVLVIRRASARQLSLATTTVPATARDRVLVVSSLAKGQLFVPRTLGNQVPAGFDVSSVAGEPPPAEVRSLVVHAYYVSVDSGAGRNFPALRRKVLISGPGVSDEEIAAGVEDLQFRIGLDVDRDARVDTYAEPGPLPIGAVPVTVQVWLRLRSQERDGTRGSSPAVIYADRVWPATTDGYDRIHVTKTIHLRNTDE
jgi:type IV pilus assembly protein PilW